MFKLTTRWATKALSAQRTTPWRQPAKVFSRSVHAYPKEYNSLQSAAHHFKQQRHMPYFLEYLMWVVFGSEALHLIWLKMDYKEYRERTAHKTKLLEELIQRIEQGEQINDSLRQEIKMVILNNKLHTSTADDIDDDYLNQLIASSMTEEKEPEKKSPSSVQQDESKWLNVDQKTEGKTGQTKPFFL